MIERLEKIKERYDETTSLLSSEEVLKDIKKMTELSKEQVRLKETVELYLKYKKILNDIKESKELIHDKELGEFAKEDWKRIRNLITTTRS